MIWLAYAVSRAATGFLEEAFVLEERVGHHD
jgi:hypothetical protein